MAKASVVVQRGLGRQNNIFVVTIARPQCRNAVDGPCAKELVRAFEQFERDETARVAILCGADGMFCAGADLKANLEPSTKMELSPDGAGPMGCSRMRLSKPVIAAVAVPGYAVAGGLELALWCDLRVVERTAVFGVFCRRWGVPLIDGGTVRLPRLIGLSRALDMVLTGREVGAEEALEMGLANRVVEHGQALEGAMKLAERLAAFPQICMNCDRASCYESFEGSVEEALRREFLRGVKAVAAEGVAGMRRFKSGEGRHGKFDHDDIPARL